MGLVTDIWVTLAICNKEGPRCILPTATIANISEIICSVSVTSSVCLFILVLRRSLLCCPGWSQTPGLQDHPTSASQVAEITGTYHHTPTIPGIIYFWVEGVLNTLFFFFFFLATAYEKRKCHTGFKKETLGLRPGSSGRAPAQPSWGPEWRPGAHGSQL
jgi:hypothetical protein